MIRIDKKRLQQIFYDLISIKSVSGKEKALCEHICTFLKRNAVNVMLDNSPVRNGISDSPNILAKIKGDRKGNWAFATHMDTVSYRGNITPILEDGVYKSKGNTILGADDKAAIACLLYVVEKIYEDSEEVLSTDLIFTVCEETGLLGADLIDLNDFDIPENIAVLDGSGRFGTITKASPYYYRFDIKIKGKAAHAGSFPKNGINAMTAAAKLIYSISPGRIDKDTTLNYGSIISGKDRNVVPEKAYIKGEIRSHDQKRCIALIDYISETMKDIDKKTGTVSRLIYKKEFSGYSHDLTEKEMIFLKKNIEKTKTVFKTKKSGGGADANIFNEKDFKAFDISIGMIDPHSNNEMIYEKDMTNLIRFIYNMIKDR